MVQWVCICYFVFQSQSSRYRVFQSGLRQLVLFPFLLKARDSLAREQITECFVEEILASASEEVLTEAARIACQCLSPDAKLRPTMVEVVKMLDRLQTRYDDNYTISRVSDCELCEKSSPEIQILCGHSWIWIWIPSFHSSRPGPRGLWMIQAPQGLWISKAPRALDD